MVQVATAFVNTAWDCIRYCMGLHMTEPPSVKWDRDRLSSRPFDQLHPARPGLDRDLAFPIADAAGQVISRMPGDQHRKIRLDLPTRRLNLQLRADRRRDLERDVTRAGLDTDLAWVSLEIGSDCPAAGLEGYLGYRYPTD